MLLALCSSLLSFLQEVAPPVVLPSDTLDSLMGEKLRKSFESAPSLILHLASSSSVSSGLEGPRDLTLSDTGEVGLRKRATLQRLQIMAGSTSQEMFRRYSIRKPFAPQFPIDIIYEDRDTNIEGGLPLESAAGVSAKPLKGRALSLSSIHSPVSRTLTFMVPSPAGAVFETLNVAANFDSPLVYRPEHIETEGRVEPGALIGALKPAGSVNSLKILCRSEIYVWTVFTLCALIFVVTGIQYWSTKYLIVDKKVDERLVHAVFSATAASAPTIGVFLGAYTVDRMGGYRSTKGMFRSLWFCLVSGCCATAASVIASFLESFHTIIAMMWILLFFGGMILPPATGIIIASVDPSVRSFASGVSIFTYNIFGYALGTFLPGAFMTWFGLNIGMKVIFYWSLFGVFGATMALIYAWKNKVVAYQMNIMPYHSMPSIRMEQST